MVAYSSFVGTLIVLFFISLLLYSGIKKTWVALPHAILSLIFAIIVGEGLGDLPAETAEYTVVSAALPEKDNEPITVAYNDGGKVRVKSVKDVRLSDNGQSYLKIETYSFLCFYDTEVTCYMAE